MFSPSFENSIDLVSFLLDLVSNLLELTNSDNQYTMIDQECLFEIEDQLLAFHNFLESE